MRFLKLRDELKDIDINLYIYQYEKSNERIKTLEGSIGQLSEQINAAETAAEALSSTLAEGEEAERRISASINEISQKLLEATSAFESHSNRIRVKRRC